MTRREIKAKCEICGKKTARGFGFKQPENFEGLVKDYMEKEKAEFPHEIGVLTGERLKMAVMDSDSSIRREIRRRDQFAKQHFPKDECLAICHYCADEVYYFVSFRDFTRSPFEFIDWVTHLDGKQWMSWDKLAAACKRIRKF
jgi:hypothetical protein